MSSNLTPSASQNGIEVLGGCHKAFGTSRQAFHLLTEGINVFPSLRLASRKNGAFYNSVVFSEKNIQNFTSSDFSKLLTLTSVIDEFVPPKTSIIKGASNKRIPMIGHMLSITFATIAMRTMMINFLKPPN